MGNYGALDTEVVELIREDFSSGGSGEGEDNGGGSTSSVAEKIVMSSLRSLSADDMEELKRLGFNC